tara:strand:- start:812 stop:1171 length:360 start_codon:yes stop_codon:yes gene_type:complete
MAHFAEIGENDKVLRVIVVANEENVDGEGNENEVFGAKFCRELLGGTWKQTSYNNSFRKRFAGLNFTYDSEKDAFIPPKPFNSWTLNESTLGWDAPVSYPEDGNDYIWDEPTTSWKSKE